MQDLKAACICAKLMANFELLTFSITHEITMIKEAQLAVMLLLRNTGVIFFPLAVNQFTRKQKRNQAPCKWCKCVRTRTEPNLTVPIELEQNRTQAMKVFPISNLCLAPKLETRRHEDYRSVRGTTAKASLNWLDTRSY